MSPLYRYTSTGYLVNSYQFPRNLEHVVGAAMHGCIDGPGRGPVHERCIVVSPQEARRMWSEPVYKVSLYAAACIIYFSGQYHLPSFRYNKLRWYYFPGSIWRASLLSNPWRQ